MVKQQNKVNFAWPNENSHPSTILFYFGIRQPTVFRTLPKTVRILYKFCIIDAQTLPADWLSTLIYGFRSFDIIRASTGTIIRFYGGGL